MVAAEVPGRPLAAVENPSYGRLRRSSELFYKGKFRSYPKSYPWLAPSEIR